MENLIRRACPSVYGWSVLVGETFNEGYGEEERSVDLCIYLFIVPPDQLRYLFF
jgi:hypothetical protein